MTLKRMVIFVFVILQIISTIFNGYVLKILWGWFLVPILNAPVLTIAGAIGMILVTQFLTYKPSNSDDKPDAETIVATGVSAITYPSVGLLMGFVIKQFI